eukprot:COSAG03_NODE_498_length_7409_cov_13.310534_12_plen_137_part_00
MIASLLLRLRLDECVYNCALVRLGIAGATLDEAVGDRSCSSWLRPDSRRPLLARRHTELCVLQRFTSLRSGVYAVRLCGDLTHPVWLPNVAGPVSREVRGIPSAGFHAPWYKPPPRAEGYLGSLPHDTWSRCALCK